MTNFEPAVAGAAIEVEIANAADRTGANYFLPLIGTVDAPTGDVLIGIRHDYLVLGLPGHAAVRWALDLAHFTLSKTQSVQSDVRDELVEETRALLATLEGLKTHNARVLQ